MRKTIDKAAAAVAPVLIVLTGGLLFLPLGLAFLYVLSQHRKEIERGELDDAKIY